MINFLYDALNSFGAVDLTASAAQFPNVIDLGGASIGRMTVDVKHTGDVPVGGTSIIITVQGADDEAFTSGVEPIGARTIPLADLLAGKGQAAINPNEHRYVRVQLAKSGSFTAGTVEAFINTNIGK